MNIDKELVKLGLSEKEAKVYLAGIQLGASTVQKISQKAQVNRATTYVIIEGLMEKGVMSTFEEGKKTFYVAERPDRVLAYFKNQKDSLEEKVKRVQEIMPELDSLYNDHSDRPRVKYFDGVEGLRSIYDDFTESLKAGDEILTFIPKDEFDKTGALNTANKFIKNRQKKKVGTRILYTSKFGRDLNYEERINKNAGKAFFVEYERYPFQGSVNIYAGKIFMFSYKESNMGGVLIENKILADSLRAMFEIAWSYAETK